MKMNLLKIMKYRIRAIIGVVLLVGVLIMSAGCDNSVSKVVPLTFPTVTAMGVPDPAPVPWSDITTYTEETYEINTKVEEEFAIGMYATMLPQQFMKSYDQNYISLKDDQVVEYQSSTTEGTEWFLFKATKKGNTEIIFQYPLEFTKIFKISTN
jgi:hypothetical protein